MDKIVLGTREFRDRVHACWLGKNIGGTLGTPHEGRRYVHDLTFYDPSATNVEYCPACHGRKGSCICAR